MRFCNGSEHVWKTGDKGDKTVIMKRFGIRLISIAMTAVMLFTFAACNNTGENDRWDLGSDVMNNAVELTVTLDEETADRTVTVTYPQDIFEKNIDADDIRLTKYFQNFSEDSDEASDFGSYELQENVQLKFISAKELELSFTETEQNVWMYEVVVHKEAVTENVFARGGCFPTVVEELNVTPEAEIEGTYTNSTSDPVITINLTGTRANADMTAEMVTLSGAFAGLDVVSVSAAGNTVRIGTIGSVAQGTSLTGIVSLTKEATDCGRALSAATEVEYRALYVDETSYSFANGALLFEVVSLQDKFTGADAVSSDKGEVEFVSVSEDKTMVTLSVAAGTADEAAELLNGSSLTFGGEMFVSGSEYQVYVSLPKASFAANIDYVSIQNGTGNATAYIYASGGSFGKLDQSSFTFGGDFASASVNSLTEQTDGSYIITFTFQATVEEEDDFELGGTISVSEGKVMNIWGTASDNNAAQASYYSLSDRGETWDAVMAFVNANKGVFSTIGTVGSAIGGVSSAVNGVNTILQLVGAVESTDDKLEKINQSLENIAGSIAQLDKKLNSMATLIIQNGVDEAERSYLSQRNQASMAWEQYLTKVTLFNSLMSKYNVNFYRELVNFINTASEYEVTIYLTEEGEITLPGRIDGYDVEGQKIVSVSTKQLGFELEGVKAKVAQYGAVYDGIWNDIADEVGQLYTDDSTDADTYIAALKLMIAHKAFGDELAADIVNAFRDMCYALAGSSLGSPVSAATVTPLDHYYTMLGCYYNFASEAKADMEAILGWLSGYIVKGAGLATFAMACENGVTVSDKDEINKAYALAVDEITSQADQIENRAGKIWSFIADNTLKVSELDICYVSNDNYDVAYKDELPEDVYFNYGNALTQTNLEVMQNRWNRLHEAGIVSYATFIDYLIGVGLITDQMKNAYVMVGPAYNAELPTDNSVSLKVWWVFKSDWFTVGKTYPIGTNEKYSAEYFFEKSLLLGKAYRLSDGSTVTRLFASARYFESHWYWAGNDELAAFSYSIDSDQPFIAFEIGK